MWIPELTLERHVSKSFFRCRSDRTMLAEFTTKKSHQRVTKSHARVIFARNDLLTPFDLRAQNFRVTVEFSTQHRGSKFFRKNVRKKIFLKLFLKPSVLDL